MGKCFSKVNSNENIKNKTNVSLRMAVMGDQGSGKSTLIRNCFTEW